MSQFTIVCFDVTDKKRLRQVAIQMENFGLRVQYSVFECYLDANRLQTLKERIDNIIDPTEDHVRYYGLCQKDVSKILLDGKGKLSRNDNYHLV